MGMELNDEDPAMGAAGSASSDVAFTLIIAQSGA
jgi:hypothetical protein